VLVTQDHFSVKIWISIRFILTYIKIFKLINFQGNYKIDSRRCSPHYRRRKFNKTEQRENEGFIILVDTSCKEAPLKSIIHKHT